MKNNSVFQSYYSRLAKEGLVKSLLCGLGVAACVLLFTAFGLWLSGVKGFWIAIIAWGVALAISAPAFYFIKFRPTTKEMARRVDLLGLEERILTMTELEGDNSFMAMKQREDAQKALATVNASLLKFAVSASLIVAVASVTVLGAGMTTVSALADAGVIKTVPDIIDDKPAEFVDLAYYVYGDEGGFIEGDFIQRIEKGQDGAGVLAVADDGYAFVKWNDGLEDPYRKDTKLIADAEYYAIFLPVEDEESEDGEEGDEGEPGEDNEKPGEPGSEGSSNDGSGSGGLTGGGKWDPNEQVLDNNTYYGDLFGEAMKDGIDKVTGNGNIPSSGKDVVSGYYQGTEAKGSGSEGGE